DLTEGVVELRLRGGWRFHREPLFRNDARFFQGAEPDTGGCEIRHDLGTEKLVDVAVEDRPKRRTCFGPVTARRPPRREMFERTGERVRVRTFQCDPDLVALRVQPVEPRRGLLTGEVRT